MAGGLIDVSGGLAVSELRDVESSLGAPNVGRIVAAQRGQRQDLALRRLVRDYRFDYLTPPCDRGPAPLRLAGQRARAGRVA